MGLLTQRVHFTTHRLSESPESNADSASVRLGGPAVVVDGASVSYDPRGWTALIASNIDVGDPLPQLTRLAGRFTSQIPEELPWNLEVLAERGAHATYLTLRVRRFMGVDSLEVDAVGDCLLLIHRPDSDPATVTWPYSKSTEFPHAPSTASSVAPLIRGTRHPTFRCSVSDGARFFLMTDAMGRYTCRHLEQGRTFDELVFTRPGFGVEDFVGWSTEERVGGWLEDDDLTVVEVGVV